MYTPASRGVVATRKLDTVHENLDDSVRSSSSEDEESVIDHIVDEECDNESMVSTIADDDSVNEEECEFGNERVDEDSYIWYYVYRVATVKPLHGYGCVHS